MAHLTPETFVDLLDGTRADHSEPHLAVCVECQRQLAGLRAASADVSGIEVPEPPSVFWNHLSARVRDAIEAEPRGLSAWFHGWTWQAGGLAAVGVLALLAAMLVVRDIGPASSRPREVAALPADTADAAATVVVPAEDDSFGLVADLAGDLDWEAAVEATLPARGGVERAVADLTEPERVELQRLLTDALEHSGA